MAVTCNINNRTVVHKSSGGVVTAFPDVCKTPRPYGSVDISYTNVARSVDIAKASKSVKFEGNGIMLKGSNFSTSTGDEDGSNGGVVSGIIKGKAEFINFSFDVRIEGKSVARMGDPMLQNIASAPNTAPTPEMQ